MANNSPSVLWKNSSKKHDGLQIKAPVLRYFFDEGKGDVVRDSGLASNHLNLLIPKYIRTKKESFLSLSFNSLLNKSRFSDLIINVLIFIPLGILIHGILRIHYGLTLKISLIVFLIGFLFSFGVESIQHFTMTRDSSLIDVATNMMGTVIGILIYRVYILYLKYQAECLQTILRDRKN
jgi:glycopeptide antibiotics resistance protein